MDVGSRRLSLPAQTPIFGEGEIGDCAYLIQRGGVEIAVLRNGRKVVLATLGRGELFGELSLIDDAPRSASATTIEETVLLAVSRDAFRDKLVGTDPLVALFMRAVVERFHEARERLLSFVAPGNACAVGATKSHTRQFWGNRRATVRELALRNELDRALRDGQLRIYLQPIVALRGHAIAGFEALVRWHHPTRGVLGPASFVHFAEGTGQILAIGAWIFEEACRLRGMLENIGDKPFISVNLSAKQFQEPDLAAHIAASVERWHVNPSQLKFEITESALMDDPQRAAQTLGELRRRGFALAIDDFGTGYSSFSYLVRFPLDSLKIDKSFVDHVTHDHKSALIVRSLATLAHSLGMTVIAEGVETSEQASALEELGCDQGQGHYYSVAIPFAQARCWAAA